MTTACPRAPCGKKKQQHTDSHGALLFFVPYFTARLDFPSPPLSAPGSPRMGEDKKKIANME